MTTQCGVAGCKWQAEKKMVSVLPNGKKRIRLNVCGIHAAAFKALEPMSLFEAITYESEK